jgi:hypothetical protein
MYDKMIKIEFSRISALPEADIGLAGPVSEKLLQLGIRTFRDAAWHVRRLPYGENTRSLDSLVLLSEGRGTCITKHGLVARLASELALPVFRLEGFYRLNDGIVAGTGAILAEYGIEYIPRTHCFLACPNGYVDLTEGNCTGKNGTIESYIEIFRVKPDTSEEENELLYRSFYKKMCGEQSCFANLGVEKMLEVLGRCRKINAERCALSGSLEHRQE